MKLFRLTILLFAAVTLSACNPEDYQHPDVLKGIWVSVANAKDPALILEIYDEALVVKDGSWNYRPFTSDEEWDYHMDRDSVLHISRYEYDSDGDYTESSHVLDLSFSNSFNTLTLYYKPLFSSVRKYTFMRR